MSGTPNPPNEAGAADASDVRPRNEDARDAGDCEGIQDGRKGRDRVGGVGDVGGGDHDDDHGGGHDHDDDTRAGLRDWHALLLLGGWTLVLAIRTWRAWADPIVDFGRELYVPWRLAEGDVLYRDIAYFNGPLSAYWNAVWFRVGGVGLVTLAWVDLALLGGLLVVLYRLLVRLGDRLTAVVALLFVLFTFAFGQTSGVGNYSFLAPYSHEATHGLLLAVLALAALAGERVRTRHYALAGVFLGLAFLTKAELFVAGLAGVTVVGVLRRRELERASVAFAAGAVGLLVPPLLAGLLLSLAMTASMAWRGALGTWVGLFGSETTRLEFYRGDLGLGVTTPLANLGIMLAWAAGAFALFGIGELAARRVPREMRSVPAIVFVAVCALLWLLPVDWGYVGRPLPLLVLAGIVFVARGSAVGALAPIRAVRLGFLVFALAATAKMLLATKLWHYGFVLALPATLAVALGFVSWAPCAVAGRGSNGAIVRAIGLAVLGFVGWTYSQTTFDAYARRNVEVGARSEDTFLADVRGVYVNRALAEIERRVGRDDTLLVLPEGIMLNYLSRRRAPTRLVNFMPPETTLFGEAEMLAELQASPPDAVLLLHKDTSEYGLPLFGTDYGVPILAWVRDRYAEVWRDPDGGPPLEPGSGLGSALLLPRR